MTVSSFAQVRGKSAGLSAAPPKRARQSKAKAATPPPPDEPATIRSAVLEVATVLKRYKSAAGVTCILM